jgi:hypothetical protein
LHRLECFRCPLMTRTSSQPSSPRLQCCITPSWMRRENGPRNQSLSRSRRDDWRCMGLISVRNLVAWRTFRSAWTVSSLGYYPAETAWTAQASIPTMPAPQQYGAGCDSSCCRTVRNAGGSWWNRVRRIPGHRDGWSLYAAAHCLGRTPSLASGEDPVQVRKSYQDDRRRLLSARHEAFL